MELTENSCRFPFGEEGKILLSEMNIHHAEITAHTLNALAAQNGDTILDIGCGGGRALKLVSQQNPSGKLYGVDYSETSVACSTEENKEDIASGKMQILHGSVSELPFTDKMFDKVYSIESYFFWPDLQNDLKEIFRVLKPGGKVCISEHIMNLEEYDEETQLEIIKLEMHTVSSEEFTKLLKNAGFIHIKAHIAKNGELLCMEAQKPE